MPSKETNGWNEYSRLVLAEQGRLHEWCSELDKRQVELSIALATLKVKAGVWGALMGLAAALIPVLLLLARGKL